MTINLLRAHVKHIEIFEKNKGGNVCNTVNNEKIC